MTFGQFIRFLLGPLAVFLTMFSAPGSAAPADDVQVGWRLLDYIAVDYRGAVVDGRVSSPSEYSEMREFAHTVGQKLQTLPPTPVKPSLLAQHRKLVAAIDRKASPRDVQSIARALASGLLAAYPVTLAPSQAPDMNRAARLFQDTCASCHGASGDARTPAAAQLDPRPIDFTDRKRADQRSPFALYQVISQGIEGTAMASFSSLPTADRWALAYYAGRFAYPESFIGEGKRNWESDAKIRERIPDLQALSGLSADSLNREFGAPRAAAVIAYLRANPESVSSSGSTLTLAKQRLRESLAAYRSGDRDAAKSLALSAYLDGFEPVEAALRARNAPLMFEVEKAMGELRASLERGDSPTQVSARAAALNAMFVQVEAALEPERGSALSTFLGASTILLREGLEALLIVVAMLAFLRKGGRTEMTRSVHYGWLSALVGGVLTWWVATELITVSGATRELTEGFGSLFAAAVLLFVGVWMHGKAQADEWQRYIRQKLGNAVTRGSPWFLFSLAFISVYREIFETILFYIALASGGHIGALIAGAATGSAVLAAVAIAMLRFSQRLPISKFFAYSAALMAVLTVVLAGKGVAALQEAGLIGLRPVGTPRIEWLGMFPTVQVVTAQILVLVLLIAGFTWNRLRFAARAKASL